MKTYVLKRLAIVLVTLLGMSVVIFVLLRLAPGDVVDILFSAAGYVNPAEKQAIMRELGLDRPYWRQYLDWLAQMATGDLGKSYRYDVPAWQIVRPLLPVTLELGALSIVASYWVVGRLAERAGKEAAEIPLVAQPIAPFNTGKAATAIDWVDAEEGTAH